MKTTTTTSPPYCDGVIRIDRISANEVRGYVGQREVITLVRRPSGRWIVGSSACLPTDACAAWLDVGCMVEAFTAATALAFDAA